MPQNKINIALLLGDPSGIGPELVSKLLTENITNNANVVVIGEKNVLENGNKISGHSHNLKFVEIFNELKKILEISDLAKFAKSKPTDNENIECIKLSVKFVNQTKLIDDTNE